MYSKISKKSIIILALLFSITMTFAYEGRPWIDENGNKTDLINLNPDPDGDPWISGGMKPLTPQQLEKSRNILEVQFLRKTRNRTLPAEIILPNNDEFPHAFNQIGGSCGPSSSVGYTYTYQVNVLKGVAATPKNARAYGFTHNLLNGGNSSQGAMYQDCWEILKTLGNPDITTFHDSANGGLNGTRWMNGADRWHTANDNRVVKYEKITIKSIADIDKIKNWMYDLNGTDPFKKGGSVVFAANSGSAMPNDTVSSGTHSGEKVCTTLLGWPMNHAMTFAGYSDSINGGSLLLLNSWGENWGTNGYVWVPYSNVVNGGLYSDEVLCVTVKEHTPKFELRAIVSSADRSSVLLKAGFANGSASTPTTNKGYACAFNLVPGSFVPMEGSGGSQSIEISLDVSEFYDDLTGTNATFFLKAFNKSSGFPCSVQNLTLVDYTGTTPVEYAATQTNVAITSDTVLIPIFYGSKDITRYKITATAIGNGTISPSGVDGVYLVDSAANQKYTISPDTWHTVDSVLVDGINVGANSTYDFLNVTAEHTIDVYFGLGSNATKLYTISNSTDPNGGTIDPAGDVIFTEEGTDTTLTITPNLWYVVDSVLVDGKNLGPLVSAHFTYLSDNHTIEPFFGTKVYNGKYTIWNATTAYEASDKVHYNQHIWKASYWNQGVTPNHGSGNGDITWQDLGKDVSYADTMTIAWLEYISNKEKIDTLIITTKTIINADTVTTIIDTITDFSTASTTLPLTANITKGYILQNGTRFFAPSHGIYSVSLFDLRGRLIKRLDIQALKTGVISIPINRSILSKGVYLMRLSGKQTKVLQKVTF